MNAPNQNPQRALSKWVFVPLGLVGVVTGVIAVLYAGALVYYVAGVLVVGQNNALSWKALDAAKPTAPYLSDLLRLFPEARVQYRHFGGSDGPGYDVEVYLHGRYELRMQMGVDFSTFPRRVTGFKAPEFWLWEMQSFTQFPGGGAQSTYTGHQRSFGSNEWQTVVANGGDFGAIGYAMVTNRPVKPR